MQLSSLSLLLSIIFSLVLKSYVLLQDNSSYFSLVYYMPYLIAWGLIRKLIMCMLSKDFLFLTNGFYLFMEV